MTYLIAAAAALAGAALGTATVHLLNALWP